MKILLYLYDFVDHTPNLQLTDIVIDIRYQTSQSMDKDITP